MLTRASIIFALIFFIAILPIDVIIMAFQYVVWGDKRSPAFIIFIEKL